MNANDSPPEAASQLSSEPTVVGIGASAGGLAALKILFEHIPADSGLALVVVVHLSPEHESHLANLLQPHVKIPVQQVTDTVRLEPNHVYVIPPGYNLSTIDTHLRLSKLEARRRERAPIDHFFRTLARTHDGHAIGVILTGTGHDGTQGLQAIKAQGGLTVVQAPAEAEYDQMPRSALATGLVDLVLPLAEIPAAILRFTRTEPRVELPEEGAVGEGPSSQSQLLQHIFAQLQAHTGRDYSRYKRSTIRRRLTRRMQLRHVETLSMYLDLLRAEPAESRALGDDLLITVTTFFRDPAVFQQLAQDVIPALFEGKGPADDVRVWSVGCATGEEAYSLAILLLEEASRHETRPQLQIFASDLHERSLKQARTGWYASHIERDVSTERLKRFFQPADGGYRLRQEVREIVLFTPHNLLNDPPFSKLDLIACRNVLIYLQSAVQQEVIALFHYALRAEGFLVLGPSETIHATTLFRTADKQHCLYQKRNVPASARQRPVFPITAPRLPTHPVAGEPSPEPLAYGALHQRLVEWYALPSLVVSPEDRIVHLSEQAGRYLVHPGGELTANVFKLVRTELHLALRTALYTARAQGQAARSKPIPVRLEGETHLVALHVRPALAPEQQGFVLIIFDEWPDVTELPAALGSPPPDSELQAELARTKQQLQAVIDRNETSEAEMKAANEELQSTNEELRSTMEELMTSKEELQSMYEELQTISQENRHKVEELVQLSSDLQNLLAATHIATLFLDRTLRILRFTPKVGELFNVRTTDQGRPLADFTHRLGYRELLPDAERVLEQLIPVEREIRDETGQWYLTRILPYRSVEDRIEGVVMTFIEITARKHAEEALAAAKRYAERIIETLHEPLLVLTPDLRVKSANPDFYEHFQVHPEDTEGRLIYELGNGQWNIAILRQQLTQVVLEDHVFNNFEVEHHFERIGHRVMLLNARPMADVELILVGIRDITAQKQAETALIQLNETLETRVEARTHQVRQQETRVREMASRLTIAEQVERRRIAQILHDDLQQILYGIEAKVVLIRQQVQAPDAAALTADLDRAQTWIDQAIAMTRQLTIDLSPPILLSEGLAETLAWLKNQMAELHGLEVTIETEHPWLIPDADLRVFLFQVVRELLFNIKKHAGVDQATIQLTEEAGRLVIHVLDAGQGFEVAALADRDDFTGGFGLFSVRERLGLLGGRLVIHAQPGQGTHVEVYTPVQPV